MKRNKKSPDKFRQAKITSFGSSSSNITCHLNKKRKNDTEVTEMHISPIKKVALLSCKSPNLFDGPLSINTKENKYEELKVEVKHEFDNLDFGDFENDIFSSPKKQGSPKKNILQNNSSENEAWEEQKSDLKFDSPVKCKVDKVKFLTHKNFEQILLLNDIATNKTGVCRLRNVWTSFSFSVGDIVSVQATFIDGNWVVDNKTGYIVLNPDLLITSTTITGLMYCMRRGILSQMFKEMDSEGNNRMLIGRLVHELFQESLKVNPNTDDDFCKIIANFIQSRDNLRDFFFSGMSISDIEKELKSFIPRLKHFLSIYVKKEVAPSGKNFNGSIQEVVDIEELLKSSKLGFQGRVDVTVKLKAKQCEKIAPLELKTGKASFSKEHRSQLIMYILLMKELGRNVDSGLLLYLREEKMEEVLPQRDEIRNLFLLRNHFVGFFKNLSLGYLPEPVRNIKGCTKCSYLRVCTTYLKGEEGDKLSQTHPLKSIELPDIKPSHVSYFAKWNKMLRLEFEGIFQNKSDDNEISGLKLDPNIEVIKKEFKCCFYTRDGSPKQSFRPGAFINIMNEKSSRLCYGQILDVTDKMISVLTDKRLTDFTEAYKIAVFQSKYLYFNLSNLGWFLSEDYEKLRELVIDKREPGFDKNFSKADFQEKCLKNLLNLNTEQQRAILKALLCQDYLLIKGPPGTGKTQTVITLIKILLDLNKTVLVSSHTHSSIDTILLRLNNVEFLRLGALKSIHESLHKNSYSHLIESCSNVDDVQKLFERKLIASTCMGIDPDFVRKIRVDYCIIDESSQVLQPEVLRPLFCCKKFILVGDEDQLPPVVRNLEAKKLGLGQSMFEWLSSENATVKLRLQYRMNSVINSLANAVTYKGLIECGNDEVANATLKIQNREMYLKEQEWIVEVLSDDLKKSVVFLNTSDYFQSKDIKSNETRCSLLEANIIIRLITCLVKLGIREENIGIITPFWDQITILSKKLQNENLNGIELNTVDQYQGKDKDVILFSCTKENQGGVEMAEQELLNDERRLTVAITRAKHKLIIIGDKDTVIRYKPFQNLLQNMTESQIFCLKNGEKNFLWSDFIEQNFTSDYMKDLGITDFY